VVAKLVSSLYLGGMKKALILIFLSGFSFLLHAQSPKKKDTKIIVTTSDTSNLISRISVALFEKGYNPDYKDEKAGIVISKEKDFGTYSVRIRVLIKDSIITFSGQGRFYTLLKGDKDEDFNEIYFGGMKGSDIRNAWDQVESIARQFGAISRYSK
jgi:hypothetical protein